MSTQPHGATRRVPVWTFADRLRKIRTEMGMHQREFATALGVTPAAYAAWESGRNQPAHIVSLALRIEAVTGVPAAWTLGLDDAPPGPGLPRQDSNLQPAGYVGWVPDEWGAVVDVSSVERVAA